MVFLNPAFLWAAGAVLIPVIIHLFNFRKPKRMNFSSVAFVREVNRSVVRRMRLQHWLLLAMRILAILALVMMFASPVWVSGPNGGATTGARSVLILLDDSPSMQVGDPEGIFLDQATRMAKTILDQGSSQDEYLILTLSDLRPGQPFQKAGDAAARLDNLQPGHHTVSFSRVFQLIPGLMESAGMPDKTVFVLSDFQKSALTRSEDLATLNNRLDGFRITCIPIGKTRPANSFVRDMTLLDPVLEKGQPNGLSGIFSNQSSEKIEDLEVSLNLNGKQAGSTRLTVAPGDTASFTLNFTPDQSGWSSGFIRVADGVTAFDDNRYFAFNLPDTNKILVYYGEGLEDKYLKTVLDKVLRQFEFNWVPENRIGDEDPSRYDAVVMAGVRQIPAGVSRQLATWIEEGGSAFIFPHPEQDLSGLNTWIQANGVGQYLAKKELKEGIDVNSPDMAHPLFEGVFRKGKNNSVRGPVVYSWFPLQKSTQSTLTEVMKFQDGTPFLWDARPGKGQLMGTTVYPDSRMSDLPLKSIFLPILYRSLLILTHSSRNDLAWDIGSIQPVVLKGGGAEVVKLIGKDKTEFVPEQFNRPGQVVLNFQKQFPAPGIYEVTGQTKSGEKMAFNYPASESDLETVRGDELQRQLREFASENTEIKVLESNKDNLSKDLEISETGVPLWKWFLLLALIFVGAEMLLMYLGMRPQAEDSQPEVSNTWKTS
jgi:hypothetical protein